MKRSLIDKIKTPTVRSAEDILSKAETEDIFEKAKHQDGDMHPNGKWVWVASANGGKGDWRTHGGRAHSKAAGSGGSNTSTNKTTITQPSKSGAAPKPKTQRKLTSKQQTIVDNFMDKVKTSDSRYSDPSKVTLWKTPKGNWYVKYDGNQVATIAPLGLTERIAEAAGMKIDREPSSYQSKKSDTTKQKKLRPVGTGTNGPERRRKETKSSKKSLTMESVKEDDLKDCKPGSVIKTKRPGNGTPITYTKTSSGKWDYEDGFRDKKDYLTDGEVARHIRSMSDKKLYPGYSTDFSSLK